MPRSYHFEVEFRAGLYGMLVAAGCRELSVDQLSPGTYALEEHIDVLLLFDTFSRVQLLDCVSQVMVNIVPDEKYQFLRDPGIFFIRGIQVGHDIGPIHAIGAPSPEL